MDHLRTVEETRRRVERLEAALRRRDEDALDDILHELTRGLEIEATCFDAGALILHRARLVEASFRPTNVDALSYAPSETVTEPHRAGAPGEAVFYGSLAPLTAIREVKPQPGDGVLVSTWTNTRRLVLSSIGFGAPAEAENATPSTSEAARGNQMVLDYLYRQFAMPVPQGAEDRYLLTAAVARLLGFDPNSTAEFEDHAARVGGSREEGSPFDGLLFPSIQAKGREDNVALRPHSVDRHMRCLGARMLEVRTMRGDEPELREIATARPETAGGVLCWKDGTRESGADSA